MSENQRHGKSFEGIVKSCTLFSERATDRERPSNSPFDIYGEDDLIKKFPTSVKSASYNNSGTIVGLSDARFFFNSFENAPYRIMVGVYKQIDEFKEFFKIYEFIVSETSKRDIFFGKVDFKTVESLHYGIGLEKFPKGKHSEARIWVKEQLSKIKDGLGIIKLNPKIDSKSQRRLQCSVKLSDLISILNENLETHTSCIGDISLPIKLKSPIRQFRSN